MSPTFQRFVFCDFMRLFPFFLWPFFAPINCFVAALRLVFCHVGLFRCDLQPGVLHPRKCQAPPSAARLNLARLWLGRRLCSCQLLSFVSASTVRRTSGRVRRGSPLRDA